MPQPKSPLSRSFQRILSIVALLIIILVLMLLIRVYAG